ncbi:unnamed protein product [Penicillium bialowiezense]
MRGGGMPQFQCRQLAHGAMTQKSSYGPGYVPGISRRDQGSPSSNEEADDDDARSVCSASSDGSRRSSLSLKSLRPGRISGRSTSHSRQHGDDSRRSKQSPADFAYKPIQQHYPTEVETNPKRPGNRFNYIPTSGRYLQDVRAPPPRSYSTSSHRNFQHSRDSYAESMSGDRFDRFDRDSRSTVRANTYDDDHRTMRSSLAVGSESSRRGSGLPSRRRTSPFVPADRKRASSKPLTMAMVPDPDDLYE